MKTFIFTIVSFLFLFSSLSPTASSTFRNSLFNRLNKLRKEAELAPLEQDPIFTGAAQAHAQALRSGEFFGNSTPAGTGPLQRIQVRDNEFLGQVNQTIYEFSYRNPRSFNKKIMKKWRETDKAPANILQKEVSEIGLGISRNTRNNLIYLVIITGFHLTKLEKYRKEARIEIFSRVNYFREGHGLNSLKTDTIFQQAARNHALTMKFQDFFAHKNINGETPFERINNIQPKYARRVLENLALHSPFKPEKLARRVIQGWANSSGHRKNLLTEEIKVSGLGISFDHARNRIYIVHDFGNLR